jgi:hypothetical protein
MKGKLGELVDEFRTVVAGRGSLIDAAVPPIAFALLNAALGLDYATWVSLGLAAVITLVRLLKRQRPFYALGGLAAVVVAVLVARLLNRAEGYFLPGIATGAATLLICGISAAVRRPLVAWTSHIARRWPLGWYWHPRVRPAYGEVTWVWTVFFALRLWAQIYLFRGEQAQALAILNVILGWPATVVLLAASYLYGTWRLRNLGGPSVEEYRAGTEPPWSGQRRGF